MYALEGNELGSNHTPKARALGLEPWFITNVFGLVRVILIRVRAANSSMTVPTLSAAREVVHASLRSTCAMCGGYEIERAPTTSMFSGPASSTEGSVRPGSAG